MVLQEEFESALSDWASDQIVSQIVSAGPAGSKRPQPREISLKYTYLLELLTDVVLARCMLSLNEVSQLIERVLILGDTYDEVLYFPIKSGKAAAQLVGDQMNMLPTISHAFQYCKP